MDRTMSKHLVKGSIASEFVSELISKHQTKDNLGAHAIFLGQVRADKLDEDSVIAIEYSAYEEMAEKEIHSLKEHYLQEYDLHCLHIYHSTGIVKTGELSLVVMVSAAHRQDTFDLLKDIVEQIKLKVPIWKKEMLSDGSERWIKEKQLD